jgi:hypothetical protein
MLEESVDPEAESTVCSDWSEIRRHLEEFPSPQIGATESDVVGSGWVFRGLGDSKYRLEPTIEREARNKSLTWRALEMLVEPEFKSQARMHLAPNLLPDPQDQLSWLALMQHYSVPTRLLDFTFSPFVALYFAVRGQKDDGAASHVRLWAVDTVAIRERFLFVAARALSKARKRAGEVSKPARPVSVHPDDFYTIADSLASEAEERQMLVEKSLKATGTFRGELNRSGCVAVAAPPFANPRLASQQGAFLVNCAEDLTFGESLNRMMNSTTGWCRRFDIVIDASPEIEKHLFQMNIHEQSLFPDMFGLAGLIKQKIRLHWG